MTLKDYVVAIPSYRRPDTLKNKSLAVLKHYKIDPHRIHIFVADKDQKKVYEDALDRKDYHKIIVGVPGIKNIRNFMPNYFPEGQYIFYMDDDIYKVYDTVNNSGDLKNKKGNKQIPLKSLKSLIEEGFRLSEKSGITNWGVYPVNNPFFMKARTNNIRDYVGTNLCYIIGFMTGVINNRKAEVRTVDDKEDYERSIKYYLKDGGVLRFNNVTCYTKCYKEPGGMQVERTKKRIHDSAVYLTKVYPNLCTLNTTKKSGFTEVRLRDRSPDHVDIVLNRDGTRSTVTSETPKEEKVSKKSRMRRLGKKKTRGKSKVRRSRENCGCKNKMSKRAAEQFDELMDVQVLE